MRRLCCPLASAGSHVAFFCFPASTPPRTAWPGPAFVLHLSCAFSPEVMPCGLSRWRAHSRAAWGCRVQEWPASPAAGTWQSRWSPAAGPQGAGGPPIQPAPGYSSPRPGTSPGTQQYPVVTGGQLGLEFSLCSNSPSDTLHRDTFSCEGHELVLADPNSRPEQTTKGRFLVPVP